MSEWISVKERLPKPYKPVWIFWRDREVLIGWRIPGECCEEQPSWGFYSWEDEKVKWANWWLPIGNKPEPPK